MSILSRTADLVYAFRFLKLLTTNFKDTKAFKLGIIDDKGKVLKKAKDRKTADEKAAYTVFHRLVFNLKKIIPGAKVGSYAAALFLLKEHTGMSDEAIQRALSKAYDIDFGEPIEESQWYQESDKLMPGKYILNKDIAHPVTGEIIAHNNETVFAEDFVYTSGSIFNINMYKVKHIKTKQEIFVSNRDILR